MPMFRRASSPGDLLPDKRQSSLEFLKRCLIVVLGKRLSSAFKMFSCSPLRPCLPDPPTF